MLTPGQAHDVQGFGPLFRMIADRVHALLADRGYDADADAIRAEIVIAGTQAVIPAKKRRRTPALHDRRKYRLNSKTGDALPPVMTRAKAHTSASPASPQHCSGCPLSTKPSICSGKNGAFKAYRTLICGYYRSFRLIEK